MTKVGRWFFHKWINSPDAWGGTYTLGWIGQRFSAYYHFIGFSEISLGISFSLHARNMEIHLPFGFFRIGKREEDALPDLIARGMIV